MAPQIEGAVEQSDKAERDKHVPDTVGNGGMRLRWVDTTEQGERKVDQRQASEIDPEKRCPAKRGPCREG